MVFGLGGGPSFYMPDCHHKVPETQTGGQDGRLCNMGGGLTVTSIRSPDRTRNKPPKSNNVGGRARAGVRGGLRKVMGVAAHNVGCSLHMS